MNRYRMEDVIMVMTEKNTKIKTRFMEIRGHRDYNRVGAGWKNMV